MKVGSDMPTLLLHRLNLKIFKLFQKFSPVVEIAHDGAFLSEPMYGVAESGRINKVPVLMGFNSEESLASVRGTLPLLS